MWSNMQSIVVFYSMSFALSVYLAAVTICAVASGEEQKEYCHMEKVHIANLKAGDQIGVAQLHDTGVDVGIVYFHHGIYLGLKEGVIDFSSHGDIRHVPIDEFISSGRHMVRILWNYDLVSDIGGKYRTPEEVTSMATYLKDNPEKWGKFKLNERNCQHFATYCKIGVAKSMYAEKAAKKVFEFCKKQIKSSWAFSSAASSGGFVCERFQEAWVKLEL